MNKIVDELTQYTLNEFKKESLRTEVNASS